MKTVIRSFMALLLLVGMFLSQTGFVPKTAYGEISHNPLTDTWPENIPQRISSAAYSGRYYNQLNSFEKAVYRARSDSIDLLRNDDDIEQIDFDVPGGIHTDEFAEHFFNALMAFDYDHPEVFWLTKHMRAGYSYNTGTDEVTEAYFMRPDDGWYNAYSTADEVRDAEAEFFAKVEELTDQARGSIYEKVLFFHDWLVENNSYNEYVADGNMSGASGLAWSAAGALIGDPSTTRDDPVCEGYARAFKVLCDVENIECAIVSGDAGEAHMWNSMRMHNGLWYAVDVTWDDPISTTPVLRHNYFLKGSERFFRDHTEDGCVAGYGTFAFPVISEYDYNMEAGWHLGDVNCDGYINTGDAGAALRYTVDLYEIRPDSLAELYADFNCDGVINTGDATLILRSTVE